jgi:hypothetical protein
MLLVHEVKPGSLELTYMWLPTWLGMNVQHKRELEEHISKMFVGQAVPLETIHQTIIDFFCDKFPAVGGLREYLQAVEKIELPRDADGHQG